MRAQATLITLTHQREVTRRTSSPRHCSDSIKAHLVLQRHLCLKSIGADRRNDCGSLSSPLNWDHHRRGAINS